jgi:transcriptional regulator with XRE-family HTH domain
MDRQAQQTPSAVISTQLKILRTRKQWTQQQLADRLEELGFAMDRSVIAKIELFKREVSANELFAFAAALDVSPISLVFPRDGDADSDYSVTPAKVSGLAHIVNWWQGVSWFDRGPTARRVKLNHEAVERTQNALRFFKESLPNVLSHRHEYLEVGEVWERLSEAMVTDDKEDFFWQIEGIRGPFGSLMDRHEQNREWQEVKSRTVMGFTLLMDPEFEKSYREFMRNEEDGESRLAQLLRKHGTAVLHDAGHDDLVKVLLKVFVEEPSE